MNLPRKIEPCPIADYIVEMRFSTEIPKGAVFGIVYNSLKHEFNSVQNLPITQLPEQLRNSDPDLKYKPYYRMSDGNFTVQIGPNVFTLSSPIPYIGWKDFSEKIIQSFNIIYQLNIIKRVERLGLRVVNFFDDIDIFDNIELTMKINDEKAALINSTIRIQIKSEREFNSTLQLSNNARGGNEQERVRGSVIDIDTFKFYPDTNNFFDDFYAEINIGHDIEKELFFSLLKKEYLKSLNPIYD